MVVYTYTLPYFYMFIHCVDTMRQVLLWGLGTREHPEEVLISDRLKVFVEFKSTSLTLPSNHPLPFPPPPLPIKKKELLLNVLKILTLQKILGLNKSSRNITTIIVNIHQCLTYAR